MRPLAHGALIALLLGSVGCGPAVPMGPRAPDAATATATIVPVPVSKERFARQARAVLRSGKYEQERLNLLAGVVRRQLARARSRFNEGSPGAGMAALTGALYLLRAGEYRPAMIKGRTASLRAGAAEVARAGNEGRSMALYTMLRQVLPTGPSRDDVSAHLRALGSWTRATRQSGPMQAAAADQRLAVDRSLFEATLPALEAARDATTAWVDRALQASTVEQPLTSTFDREEAIEAYRAIRSGGATFIALHLRHGDAVGAYTTLEQHDLARIVPPVLLRPLERVAMENDPTAWSELFRLFNGADETDHPQTAIDGQLARAAAWGAAVELYRSNPKDFSAALPLASLLPRYGMAEVAPVVLTGSLSKSPAASEVSFCLALVLDSMVGEDQIGQLPSARRTFQAAAPLLALADSKRLVSRVHPSATRLRYVMGALETRAGELERARPLVEAVVRAGPDVDALALLAAIQRQQDAPDAALATLQKLISLAETTGSHTSVTEAWLAAFEIHRDAGAAEAAASSLRSALESALKARRLARNTPGQSRAERLLARVLDHYGDQRGARRATERAYDAAGADLNQLAATVLDASRRALTHGDLSAARDAVHRALEVGLSDEDLVYVALWLQLLERRLGLVSDGTVEEALDTVESRSGWPGKLRAWGQGQLDDASLLKAARNRVERTEALFYTSMNQHGEHEDGTVLSGLEAVANSMAIELVEVSIARDLLAEQRAGLQLELPDNVTLP
jgi:tetratricopeptide (TPR) repeat protein